MILRFKLLVLLLTQSYFLFSQKAEHDSLFNLCDRWGQIKYFNNKIVIGANLDSILLEDIRKTLLGTFELSRGISTNAFYYLMITSQQRLDNCKTEVNLKNVEIQTYHSPRFQHDKMYYELPANTVELRLYALFKIWNIFRFFSPNKSFFIEDCSRILRNNIPSFIEADTDEKYSLALMSLLSSFKDGHAIPFNAFRKKFFGRYAYPFELRIIKSNPIVFRIKNKKLCKRAHISLGDTIIKLDAKNELTSAKNAKYISVTNNNFNQQTCYNIGLDKRFTEGSFLKNSNVIAKRIKMVGFFGQVFGSLIESKKNRFKVYPNNVTYFNLTNTSPNFIRSKKKLLQFASSLIIDLRGYPRVGCIEALIDVLSDTCKVVSKLMTPNNFYNCFDTRYDTVCAKVDGFKFSGKMVVLVDEYTISQSEYCCMILQAFFNPLVIGRPTAGCDGNISNIYVPGQTNITFTGMGVFYPTGIATQNQGILLDKHLEYDVFDIASNVDTFLKTALKYIENEQQ